MCYINPYGPGTPNWSKPSVPDSDQSEHFKEKSKVRPKAADQCKDLYEQFKNRRVVNYVNLLILSLMDEAKKGNTSITIENFQEQLNKEFHQPLLDRLKKEGLFAEIRPVVRPAKATNELALTVSFIPF